MADRKDTMRAQTIPCLLLLALSGACSRGDSGGPVPLVLTHATIVDVRATDPDRALKRDQAVVIVGQRITAVGSGIAIPADADVIDVSGKFLIPGLWDMHVHVTHPSYLRMFVANGITGVRDMGGAAPGPNDGCESLPAATLIGWRERVRSGEWIGPRMLISGPAASGTGWPTSLAVRTPAEARAAVQTLRALGVDFVKVYEKIPLDAYLALARAASDARLSIAGHVPVDTVTLPAAARAGQRSVEHIRDHLLMCFTQDREELLAFLRADKWSPADVQWGLSRHGECPAAFSVFRTHGTWLVPTLTVERSKVAVEEPGFAQDPARAQLPESVQLAFEEYARRKLAQSAIDRASEHRWWLAQKRVVARMRAERIGILAGTDSACQGGVPGDSLHEELRLLVAAGLTPLEALQAATINPAEYQSRGNAFGAIEPGHLADLVVLDGNPLDRIENTRSIHAVVTNGVHRIGGKRALPEEP